MFTPCPFPNALNTSLSPLRIYALPALSDNYIWLLLHEKTQEAVIIDPGDATVVRQFLSENQEVRLSHILLTHHHADHTAGVKALCDEYGCCVFGPPQVIDMSLDQIVKDQDIIEILGIEISVMGIAGHTLEHVAYVLLTEPYLLFCGDTLFHAGCGRIFEGSVEQMYASLEYLQTLPKNTLVFPAHEYSEQNLTFAQHVEPTNARIAAAQKRVKMRLAKNLPSLPTCLSWENQINPFYRVDKLSVQQAVEQKFRVRAKNNVECFALLRQWKNNF